MALEPEERPLPPLPPLPPLTSMLVTTARSPLSPTLTDTVQYKEKFRYGEHVTLEKWMKWILTWFKKLQFLCFLQDISVFYVCHLF